LKSIGDEKQMVMAQEKVGLKEESNDEDPYIVLHNLNRAESTLLEEKKKLVNMKAKLELEVKKEIKNKMSNIQNLREEIKNMKFSCDEVSKLLQSSKKE
jgi:hypothetical protein